MPALSNAEFLLAMADKAIDVHRLAADPAFHDVDVGSADVDANGAIAGSELETLLTRMETAAQQATAELGELQAGVNPLDAMMTAALALAEPIDAVPLRELHDPALRAAFAHAETVSLTLGDSGVPATAVQYALGRLGLYRYRVDASFLDGSVEGLRDFQASPRGQAAGLSITGELNEATLMALDDALRDPALIPPALRAADPLAYLSSFTALGLSRIAFTDGSQPITWQNPEVQAAYGRFVTEYWPVLKQNRVELDCKTLSLLFMDQFRKMLQEDTGVLLPMPRNGNHRVPRVPWKVVTPEQTRGYFSRADQLEQVRGGYEAVAKIEALDPGHSMIRGPNLIYPGVVAHWVALAATPVPGHEGIDNQGDASLPEVALDLLQPGDMIFIDHSSGGESFDHTVNVIRVERDDEGRARRLVLAVASFDDMKDATSATSPRGAFEVNNYAEEVVVQLDEAGRIVASESTWSTEPRFLQLPRYDAARTIMELKQGGVLRVCRWR